jgi:ATP-dependent Zn protease
MLNTMSADTEDTATRAAHPAPDSSGQQVVDVHAALRPLARRAVGRSGADIERLVREARRVARREGRALAWSDIENAVGDHRIGIPEQVRWRMAVHEAGHALVQLAAGNGGIALISIEADHGGFVRMEEERHPLQTEAWTMSEITVRLAGRAAEELVFGDPLAGSGGPPKSDLGIATDMATLLETGVGFGRHQPLLYRATSDRSHMLALDPRLAVRVNARLEECYDAAKAILVTERDTHLWLADTILRHGVLEGDDLEAVLAEVRRRLRSGTGAGTAAGHDRSADLAKAP